MSNFKRSRSSDGRMTFVAAAAVLAGQTVKFGSSDREVTPCTAANDAAIGAALDDAEAGDTVPVAIFGAATGTVIVKATATVSRGGEVDALGGPSTTGDTTIGRALNGADDGGEIELAHCAGRAKA